MGQVTLQTAGRKISAFTSHALAHSPSFAELKRRSKHASYVVDEDSPGAVIVGIGEDMNSHFTRFNTLKIDKKTVAIARLETDQNLEDEWQVEFEPKK